MNFDLQSKESSHNSLGMLEESSSINTMKRKSQFSSNKITEITDVEIRIINWLKENGIVPKIPEEKEFQYYEGKRNTTQSSLSRICIDSPLFLRRRNSLPSNNKEINSPLKNSPILKLSKFQTCKCIEFPCSFFGCSMKK